LGVGRGGADEPRSGRTEGRAGFETFEELPEPLTPQARNVGPSGQGLSPICPQTAPPLGGLASCRAGRKRSGSSRYGSSARASVQVGKVRKWRPHTRPGPRSGPTGSAEGGAGSGWSSGSKGSKVANKKQKLSRRRVLTSHCQSLNHPSLSGRCGSRFRTTPALGKPCCTADHAQLHRISAHRSTCATLFRSGEVRTSASWLFVQSERYATSRDGPRLSRDGVPPCLCRHTAAARRTSPGGRPLAVRAG
jgi:hypothetical protein